MDIRIEFAEDPGLEVLQTDGDESGYEVVGTQYHTYMRDGRRYKTVTVSLAETDALVGDEDERLEPSDSLREAARHYEEVFGGSNFETVVDRGLRQPDPYGPVPRAGSQGAQTHRAVFGNRR